MWWKLPFFIIWLGVSVAYALFGVGLVWDGLRRDQSGEWITSLELAPFVLIPAAASLLFLYIASTEGWVWPWS